MHLCHLQQQGFQIDFQIIREVESLNFRQRKHYRSMWSIAPGRSCIYVQGQSNLPPDLGRTRPKTTYFLKKMTVVTLGGPKNTKTTNSSETQLGRSPQHVRCRCTRVDGHILHTATRPSAHFFFTTTCCKDEPATRAYAKIGRTQNEHIPERP